MHYLLLTAIAIILWASLATVANLLAHIQPFYLLSISLFVGGCLSIPRWREWCYSPSLIFIGVAGIFGYHFLLFMALRLAPAVTANLLNYLWPLFILLMTPLFFNNLKLKLSHVVGALISFSGAIFLINDNQHSWSFEYILGYSLAIFAAITWAAYSLATKKIAKFSSSTVGLFCLISSVLAYIAHLVFESSIAVTYQDYAFMLYLGAGPLGLAFYCWDSALKKGDPRVISTLSYLTPLISTIVLIKVNQSTLSIHILIAMLAILFGAFFANISHFRSK